MTTLSCDSCAIARASRSRRPASRARRSPVRPRVRSTLIAILRSSCGSRADSTTPMPPAPRTSRISKRPNAALSCSPLHSLLPLDDVRPVSIWIVGTAAGSTAIVSRGSAVASSSSSAGTPAVYWIGAAPPSMQPCTWRARYRRRARGARCSRGRAAREQAIVRVVDVDLRAPHRGRAEDAVDLGLIRAQLGAQRLQRRIVVGDDEHVEAGRRRELDDRGHAAERRRASLVHGQSSPVAQSRCVEQVVRVDLAARRARVEVDVADERERSAIVRACPVIGPDGRSTRVVGSVARARARSCRAVAVALVRRLAEERDADRRSTRRTARRRRAGSAGSARSGFGARHVPIVDAPVRERELGAADDQRAAAAVRRGNTASHAYVRSRLGAGDVGEDEDLRRRARSEPERIAGERVGADDRVERRAAPRRCRPCTSSASAHGWSEITLRADELRARQVERRRRRVARRAASRSRVVDRRRRRRARGRSP